jgi:ubiquinone/menaquinone biosynthesis C-methylase UbiE
MNVVCCERRRKGIKLNWGERLAVHNPVRVWQQRLEIKWFRKAGRLEAGKRVLEIGCGRGAAAALIGGVFQPMVLHASDYDPAMMRMARRYLAGARGKPIRLLVADAASLPYGPRAFDAVFGFGVLHHVPDWQGALQEIARVLKAGSPFFIEELYPTLYQNVVTSRILEHPEENRFQSGELEAGLAAANFLIDRRLEHPKLGILAVAIKQ